MVGDEDRRAATSRTGSADDKEIVAEGVFRSWVGKLKVSNKENFPDDYARQNARKRLLLIQNYEDKERTFTPGQLTQSSQLMKFALGVIHRKCRHAQIDAVAGTKKVTVTALLAPSVVMR